MSVQRSEEFCLERSGAGAAALIASTAPSQQMPPSCSASMSPITGVHLIRSAFPFGSVLAALTVCGPQGGVQHQPLGCRQPVGALRAGWAAEST